MLKLLPLLVLVAGLAGCATRTYTTTTVSLPAGPSFADVQSMVQAHVADTVIISQIQGSSARYFLTTDQIINLKNAGASDALLNIMIASANKPLPQPITTTTTTVVQDPAVWIAPYPYPYPYWGPTVYVGGYYRGGYYRGGYYHH